MWDMAGRHTIESTQVALVLYEKLCRIFGVRDRQATVADQEEGHLVGPGLELQVLAQASGPPPYSVSHYFLPTFL
jgi:hypothetical protein